jgi:hypothetical protein
MTVLISTSMLVCGRTNNVSARLTEPPPEEASKNRGTGSFPAQDSTDLELRAVMTIQIVRDISDTS